MNESSERGEALLHSAAHTAQAFTPLYVTIDGEEEEKQQDRQRDREVVKGRGRKRKRWRDKSINRNNE